MGRRVALLLLLVTAAGLAAGGAARLAGAGQAADMVWLGVAACGVAYACWVAVAAIARGRLSVDVIALLALADVGVAMGARGSTASSEAADAVLTVDRLGRLGEATTRKP